MKNPNGIINRISVLYLEELSVYYFLAVFQRNFPEQGVKRV